MKLTKLPTLAVCFAALLAICGVPAHADHAIPARPPKNPYLVDGISALAHFDPAQTDSMLTAGPRGIHKIKGKDLKCVRAGLVNIVYVNAPRYPNGEEVVWLANDNRIAKVSVTGKEFRELAHFAVPDREYRSPKVIEGTLHQFDSAKSEADVLDLVRNKFPLYLETQVATGGIYTMMDFEGNFYVAYKDRIRVFGDAEPGNARSPIVQRREWKVPAELFQPIKEARDSILGLNMTYDGQIAFVTVQGMVGVVDRKFEHDVHSVRFPVGEAIGNSFAIDDAGGIYVASNKAMYKVVWSKNALTLDERRGGWRAEYDVEQIPNTGVKFLQGTGSTPTLMGFGSDADRLVILTDGMRVMNIVAFWRDEIPANFQQRPGTKSRRIAGQLGVTPKPGISDFQSEQSVVALGYGAAVVNNSLPDPVKGGMLENAVVSRRWRAGPVGVEKFEWDPNADRWKHVWHNLTVGSPTVVPIVSAGSWQFYTNDFREGNWEVTGLDWDDGQVATRIILGKSDAFNGAYSIIQLLTDGDVALGGLFGHCRVNLP